MGNARKKFRVGDRVIMSPAFSGYGRAKIKFGTVTGFGRLRHLVRIKLDGVNKRGNEHLPETWSLNFWDVIEKMETTT